LAIFGLEFGIDGFPYIENLQKVKKKSQDEVLTRHSSQMRTKSAKQLQSILARENVRHTGRAQRRLGHRIHQNPKSERAG
jgi:hypothetical protein